MVEIAEEVAVVVVVVSIKVVSLKPSLLPQRLQSVKKPRPWAPEDAPSARLDTKAHDVLYASTALHTPGFRNATNVTQRKTE